jgi:hypothetical protein
MSRASIREAVTVFLEPPKVPGLNRVFTSFPKRVEGGWFRYGQPAGTQSGAIGIVHIVGEREERIAFGGEHSGKKWVHYTVELQIFSHSIHQLSERAMDDFDAVVDAAKDRLRSDRRLGQFPIIFESGERQLDGVYGEPRVLQDGSTEIWGCVRFEVSEVLTT